LPDNPEDPGAVVVGAPVQGGEKERTELELHPVAHAQGAVRRRVPGNGDPVKIRPEIGYPHAVGVFSDRGDAAKEGGKSPTDWAAQG